MKTFQCKFCGKEYKSDRTFQKHKCPQMERFMYVTSRNYLNMWKELKTVYKIKYKDEPDNPYFDMINSKLYNQVVKFFDWCKDMDINHVKDYLEYLKKKNIPATMWGKSSTYNNYIKNMIHNEHPLLAKERTEKYLKENNVTLETITPNFLYFSLLNGSISNKYLKNIGFDVRKVLDNKQFFDVKDFL